MEIKEDYISILSKVGFSDKLPNMYFSGVINSINPFYELFNRNNYFFYPNFSILISSSQDLKIQLNNNFVQEFDNSVYEVSLEKAIKFNVKKLIVGFSGINYEIKDTSIVVFYHKSNKTNLKTIREYTSYSGKMNKIFPYTTTLNSKECETNPLFKDFSGLANDLEPENLDEQSITHLTYKPLEDFNPENINKILRRDREYDIKLIKIK